MATEFKVPELGENIQGGDVVNVLVREGDTIAANQDVLELETDKAVIPLPCPTGGKVAKVHVKKGDRIKVGQTVLTIDGAAASAAPAAAPAKPAAAAPVAVAASAPAAAPAASAPAQPAQLGPLPAGPAARRIARAEGVDLANVAGSGKHGRITPEDVVAAAQAPAVKAATPAAAAPKAPAIHWEPVAAPGEPGQDNWGPIRRERMTQIRTAIANHMTRSWTTIPHVTNFDDADITDLEGMRKSVPAGLLGANIKLTHMPFVLKAVATALRRHPSLNASLDMEKGEVVYKQYVHIGIAVDTPRGLVVPVMRDVDRMGLGEIARSVASLADRARQAQFSLEDIRGGTFTISNLGAVGGTYSTPIINYPEVAILLVGRSRWLPMIRDGKTEPRFMMPLSLSYDHRLVDGAAAARFLNDVIQYLQTPGLLMLMR